MNGFSSYVLSSLDTKTMFGHGLSIGKRDQRVLFERQLLGYTLGILFVNMATDSELFRNFQGDKYTVRLLHDVEHLMFLNNGRRTTSGHPRRIR